MGLKDSLKKGVVKYHVKVCLYNTVPKSKKDGPCPTQSFENLLVSFVIAS